MELLNRIQQFRTTLTEIDSDLSVKAVNVLDCLADELFPSKEVELEIPVDQTPNICIAAVRQIIGPRSAKEVHEAWTEYRKNYYEQQRS